MISLPANIRFVPHALVARCALVVFLLAGTVPVQAEPVDYLRDVSPILMKYCAGCHNATEPEAELSVMTHEALLKGSANGPVVTPSDSAGSRIIQLITAEQEPTMPPEGEPRPDEEQIALLRRWIDEGAAGPVPGSPDTPRDLATPRVSPSAAPKPITALSCSPDGRFLAVGRFRAIDLITPQLQFIHRFDGHPGKINVLRFTPDGSQLLVGTGSTGLQGETWIWDVRRGEVAAKLSGHEDIVYALACSADGKRLATAGYDRQIHIWNLPEARRERTLLGHNGPVFDLAFTPDGTILASASADATVKIWNASTGERLDTLSQPLKEQLTVDISPDGTRVVAGGADNRLRLWQLISVDQPRINPLLAARYAHEGAIQRVRYSHDGRYLASVSVDGTTKFWNAADLTPVQMHRQEGDVAETLSWQGADRRVFVGRMDGGIEHLEVAPLGTTSEALANVTAFSRTPEELTAAGTLERIDEQEPNDHPSQAITVTAPCTIEGVIEGIQGDVADRDLFRFTARQGQTWVIEVRADRDGSPLDSIVRVLDSHGEGVPRMLLRAVRDSYFTFRGKDSMQTGDFRLFNWEEMTLNQYLYASGEVVKLYTYPRGPDSGFNVYPNFGHRHGFFDTTPVAHALHEPCYIVTAHPPGSELPPNGLPVFTLYFENDDESQRRWGTDSMLTFTAPADGEYLVQIEDVRGFQGSEYRYQLSIRAPQPDFRVKMLSDSLSIPQGSGQRFGVEVERIDGFQGEVSVEFEGLPDWLEVTQPLVIEPEHYRAWGTIHTRDDRGAAPPGDAVTAQVFATATINGQTVRHSVGDWGPIRAIEAAGVAIEFLGNTEGPGGKQDVVEIEAGTTTTAQIRIERHGATGPVSFGFEEAVANAPHGVYVDNIGLNGVLIPENETERTVFIRAEPWTPPSERWVFVESDVQGKPTSRPILLRVLPPSASASAQR